jgi:hypothetical protein
VAGIVDGTCSELCPIANFDISGITYSGYTIGELVN